MRRPQPGLIEEAAKAGLEHVLDFNQSVRFPALFEFEKRFDASHVNLVGAPIFSDYLVEALADVLEQRFARD